MRHLDLNQLQKISLDAIITKSPLQDYLDAVHDCTGLPVMVLDSTINAIAASIDYPCFSPWWELAARRAITSQDVLDNKFFHWQNQCSREVILAYSTLDGKDPAAIGPVINNGIVVATCGMLIRDADPDDCQEACRIYANTLSVKWSFIDTYIESVREIGTIENILVHTSLPMSSTRYKPGFVYAVCKTSFSGIAALQYSQNELAQSAGNFISCLDGDTCLCILFYDVNGAADTSRMYTSLSYVCNKYGLTCGISDTFFSCGDVAVYREQALLVYSIENAFLNSSVRFFSDCYTDIITNTALKHLGENSTVLSGIRQIANEDRKKETQYVQSLGAYILNCCNASKAAEQLHIHKNTLLSRLRKIEQIINQSLDDEETIRNLEVGLDIYLRLKSNGKEGMLNEDDDKPGRTRGTDFRRSVSVKKT